MKLTRARASAAAGNTVKNTYISSLRPKGPSAQISNKQRVGDTAEKPSRKETLGPEPGNIALMPIFLLPCSRHRAVLVPPARRSNFRFLSSSYSEEARKEQTKPLPWLLPFLPALPSISCAQEDSKHTVKVSLQDPSWADATKLKARMPWEYGKMRPSERMFVGGSL